MPLLVVLAVALVIVMMIHPFPTLIMNPQKSRAAVSITYVLLLEPELERIVPLLLVKVVFVTKWVGRGGFAAKSGW